MEWMKGGRRNKEERMKQKKEMRDGDQGEG